MPNPTKENPVQVIEDGDFAGFPTSDAIEAAFLSTSAALGDYSIEVATVAIDMAQEAVLAVLYHHPDYGPEAARRAAMGFVVTVAPYITGQELEGPEQTEQFALEVMEELVEKD